MSTTPITACSTPPCWYRKKVTGTATAKADRLPLNIVVPPDACQTSGAYLQATRLPLNVTTGFAEPVATAKSVRIAPVNVGFTTQGISTLSPTASLTYQYDQWTMIPAPDCLNPFNGTIVPATATLTYYTASTAASPPGCATQTATCVSNAGFSPPIPSAASATCGASCTNPFTSAPVSVGTPLVSYAASTAAVCTAVPSTCTATAGFSPTPGPAVSCTASTDGVCGTASSTVAVSAAPTNNLCLAGGSPPVTLISGPPKYTWTCPGSGAGAPSPLCSAPKSSAPPACFWSYRINNTSSAKYYASYSNQPDSETFVAQLLAPWSGGSWSTKKNPKSVSALGQLACMALLSENARAFTPCTGNWADDVTSYIAAAYNPSTNSGEEERIYGTNSVGILGGTNGGDTPCSIPGQEMVFKNQIHCGPKIGTASFNHYQCQCPTSPPPSTIGACGSATSAEYAHSANGEPAPPTLYSPLCSTGTPSGLSGAGPWTWSCSTDSTPAHTVNCSVDVASYEHWCFVAGTQITMANGSTQAIEKVKIGDIILTYDEQTRAMVPSPVTRTLHHPSKRQTFYRFFMRDGEQVVSNTEHLFYRPDLDIYMPAQIIYEQFQNHQTQHLMNKNGLDEIVRIESFVDDLPTYNLHVQGKADYDPHHRSLGIGHNYFANGLLAHNLKHCSVSGDMAPGKLYRGSCLAADLHWNVDGNLCDNGPVMNNSSYQNCTVKENSSCGVHSDVTYCNGPTHAEKLVCTCS